jgi:hypothetical protein
MTSAIGGALVDLEQRIFRGEPRVEERYERRDEVTLTATEGSTLVVGLPGDPTSVELPPESDEAAGEHAATDL